MVLLLVDPPVMTMPLDTLPEITFPEPGATPPMTLPLAPLRRTTPTALLGSAAVPETSTPIKFPCTRFPLVEDWLMTTPLPVFPEMTFPAPALVPPIVLLDAPDSISIPAALGTAAVPAALVPIKLPCTVFPLVPGPMIWIPKKAFPEITLRAAAVVPPIRLLN